MSKTRTRSMNRVQSNTGIDPAPQVVATDLSQMSIKTLATLEEGRMVAHMNRLKRGHPTRADALLKKF